MEEKRTFNFKDHKNSGNSMFCTNEGRVGFFIEEQKTPVIDKESEKYNVVLLSDLIDVIHYTIIKHRGENIVALDEIQRLEYLLKGSKELENYSVEETELWQSIMSQRNGYKTN